MQSDIPNIATFCLDQQEVLAFDLQSNIFRKYSPCRPNKIYRTLGVGVLGFRVRSLSLPFRSEVLIKSFAL